MTERVPRCPHCGATNSVAALCSLVDLTVVTEVAWEAGVPEPVNFGEILSTEGTGIDGFMCSKCSKQVDALEEFFPEEPND